MRGLGVFGGLVCIAAGVWLLTMRAVSSDSLMASIANGVGLYCVGRGFLGIAGSLLASRTPQGPVKSFNALLNK